MSFQREVRRRLLSHAVAIFFLWPLLSVLSATVTLKSQTLTAQVSMWVALVGLSNALFRMLPEFLSVGSILLAISLVIFSTVRSAESEERGVLVRMSLLGEPFIVMFALFCGLVLEFPALLRHPMLAPLRSLSALTATTAVFGVLGLLFVYLIKRRSRASLLCLLLVFFLVPAGWAVGLPHRGNLPRRSRSGSTVLLGLDSISQAENVSTLRSLTREFSGTWYEKPVTPGLLTNAVWTSILMHRPLHESGVFLYYQSIDWSRSPFQLVRRASEAGCLTSSFFSDQFSTYVGDSGGFAHVHSGPKGWMQLATAWVKNGSVFLSVALPLLPPIPGARTPANQSGTFAFDVRREIDEILTEGTGPCTLVAAHLDYLHQPMYPRYSELTASERSIVRGSRVQGLRDFSLDWQFPVIRGDELQLYRWKRQRLQNIVQEELRATGFLDQSRRNRLVLFSDHGNRRAVTPENFGRPRYHRVVLATFGIPARDPLVPISLLDISELIGFPDPSRPGPAPPVVEYTNGNAEESRLLLKSARLRADGEISLDPSVVRAIGSRLRGYAPYAPNPDYFPSPARTFLRNSTGH